MSHVILAERATLRLAVDHLADFVEDPTSWPRAHRLLRATPLNGPARRGDWGWLFELAHALWGDRRHLALCEGAPYGGAPPRAYTLGFATLRLRPLGPP